MFGYRGQEEFIKDEEKERDGQCFPSKVNCIIHDFETSEMGKCIQELHGTMQCGFNSKNVGIAIHQRVMRCYHVGHQKQ